MNPNNTHRKPAKGRCPVCGRPQYYGRKSLCAQHASQHARIVRTLDKYQGKTPLLPATRPPQQARTRCLRVVVAALFNVATAIGFLLLTHTSLVQTLLPWYHGLLALSAWLLQGAIFYWSFALERGYR